MFLCVNQQQDKNGKSMLKGVYQNEHNPINHVTSPIVTGGSVIGLKCKEGVIVGTDTLLSYGGLLKYTDVSRFQKISNHVVIAATGQYADFQQISHKLKDLSKQSNIFDDNVKFHVQDYANYLAKICYKKRNDMNPYYNNVVIAGYQKQGSFLASVDLYGNYIVKDYVVAGFAKHFGLALIANEWTPQKTFEECRDIIRRCFQVIYVRDCHSIDRIQFSLVSNAGVDIYEPQKIDSKWDFKEFRQRRNQDLWKN